MKKIFSILTTLAIFLFFTAGMSFAADSSKWVVKPGVGIGPFKLGDRIDIAIAKIGKPDNRVTFENGYKRFDWDIHWISVVVDSDKIIRTIVVNCFFNCKSADNLIKRRGLIEDVIDKWGRPVSIDEHDNYKWYNWNGISLWSTQGWGGPDKINAILIE